MHIEIIVTEKNRMVKRLKIDINHSGIVKKNIYRSYNIMNYRENK